MKRWMYLGILAVGLPLVLSAQHNGEREKIKALKIAYLTEKLDLSPSEAEKFWPLYHAYQKELRALKGPKPRAKPDALSAEEAKARIEELLESDAKRLALRRQYTAKFLEVLPPQKVLKLYRAERTFQRFLFKKLMKKKEKGERRPRH